MSYMCIKTTATDQPLSDATTLVLVHTSSSPPNLIHSPQGANVMITSVHWYSTKLCCTPMWSLLKLTPIIDIILSADTKQ